MHLQPAHSTEPETDIVIFRQSKPFQKISSKHTCQCKIHLVNPVKVSQWSSHLVCWQLFVIINTFFIARRGYLTPFCSSCHISLWAPKKLVMEEKREKQLAQKMFFPIFCVLSCKILVESGVCGGTNGIIKLSMLLYSYVSSFYRFQNILAWSKFFGARPKHFVLHQKMIYVQ